MGIFVREENTTYAEMAPPPLAWPSILVTIIAPKSALSLKARLWASAAWPGKMYWMGSSGVKSHLPMLASRISKVISGLTALPICFISSKSSLSCL
jgi:hypothetical protein